MAEDHGLCNGDHPVDVTERTKLVFFIVAEHVILLYGVQGLFLPLQFDNVGIRNDPPSELPHSVFEGGGEEQHLTVPGQRDLLPLDADALVLMALRGDHDVGLVQHEHADLLGVHQLELEEPVEHGPGRANHYLLLDLFIEANYLYANFRGSVSPGTIV
uniref:Uncharacterized protein n=1 Tax=Electrophorus electricus TaxID=8005 RepID=A0A4W4DVP9_ELEEL